MIDPKNIVALSGGLVDAPEITGAVAKFRIACDWAGSDQQNPDNKSGYFQAKYFLNTDNANTKFVRSQIENGNFKKGSQIALQGRLVQERWQSEAGDNRSGIVVYVEGMTYASSGNPNKAEGQAEGEAVSTGASVPESF